MYTTEEYEAELARYRNASRQELLLVKKNLHFRPYQNERQQARLAAIKELLVLVRKAENRERARARVQTLKIEGKPYNWYQAQKAAGTSK